MDKQIDQKATFSHAPWHVRPDYGKENVYRLWNENDNYHEDTSPEVMEQNCLLMQTAPELLILAKEIAAIEKVVRIFPDKIPADMLGIFLALGEQARKALDKINGPYAY